MTTLKSAEKKGHKKAQESQKFNCFLFFQFLSFLIIFVATSAFAYSGGTGEPNNPYQIDNVADLLELSADGLNYDKCFILTDDINLAAYTFDNALIAPDEISPFSGNFNGACHKISNFNIYADELTVSALGLFGNTAYNSELSEIKNLYLENANIYSMYAFYFGGLIGRNGGLIDFNYGIAINNCHSNVTITTGSYGGYSTCGGLVGLNKGANITNCSSGGTLYIIFYADAHGFSHPAGGLVGWNDSGSLISSHSACNVIYDGNSGCFGGLVGRNGGEYPSNIINCYSTGTIMGNNTNMYHWGIGGLVGFNLVTGIISKCFSSSPVNITGFGNRPIGGLVGYNEGDINDCFSVGPVTGPIMDIDHLDGLGGLVGYNEYQATIRHCYSSGDVTAGPGSIYFGALVGKDYESDINNSYFLNTSGPDNGLGEPLTETQMKQQASFVQWDFVYETVNGPEDVWWILENVTYPKLIWMRIPPDYGDCGSGPGGGDDDGGLYFPDYNFDNFINFFDFAVFADAWLTENPFISLDIDTDVDIYDLKIFCNDWLEGPIL